MMSNRQSPDESEIAQASGSWLASQRAGEAPDDWVESWQDERRIADDYMAMWRFVLKLCDDVDREDDETIGMIGAGPLWGMCDRWPERTLTLIEAEGVNPTLVKALAIVVTSDPAVYDRIDGILGRDNREQS
jgi:hypothetical protein